MNIMLFCLRDCNCADQGDLLHLFLSRPRVILENVGKKQNCKLSTAKSSWVIYYLKNKACRQPKAQTPHTNLSKKKKMKRESA
jgi:hypothetical protein